jgi:hypothetical protein
MTRTFKLDLKKLKARAYDRAEWAGEILRRYYAATRNLDVEVAQQLRGLYHWMFVPPTLWPFNPNSEVAVGQLMVGTARCAVSGRVQRSEGIVQIGFVVYHAVPRLNGAVTAQRAVPTNFGVRV